MAKRWLRWWWRHLKTVAVKAPGFGDRRKAMLEDIATLTGGTAVAEEVGLSLEKATLSELGQAKRIEVWARTTPSSTAAGKEEAIKARIGQINKQAEEFTSDYGKEKLQERKKRQIVGPAMMNSVLRQIKPFLVLLYRTYGWSCHSSSTFS